MPGRTSEVNVALTLQRDAGERRAARALDRLGCRSKAGFQVLGGLDHRRRGGKIETDRSTNGGSISRIGG